MEVLDQLQETEKGANQDQVQLRSNYSNRSNQASFQQLKLKNPPLSSLTTFEWKGAAAVCQMSIVKI